MNRVIFAAAAAVMAVLASCTSIPRERFDAYRQSFDQVKVATEDMLLRARHRVEARSERVDSKKDVAARFKELRQGLGALDDRQAALDTLDRYNSVLLSLTAGEDPAAIEDGLRGVASGLNSFVSSSFADRIADAVPYFGVAAELLGAIQDEANNREFARLVAAAEPSIAGIIAVLKADAPDLTALINTGPTLERNRLDEEIRAISFRIEDVAEMLLPSDKLAEVYKLHNGLLQSIAHGPKKRIKTHKPKMAPAAGSGAAEATATTAVARAASEVEIGLLHLILAQERDAIRKVNALTAKIAAQERVTLAYQQVLDSMLNTFKAMNSDLQASKAQATFDFIQRGLDLRRTIITAREGAKQ